MFLSVRRTHALGILSILVSLAACAARAAAPDAARVPSSADRAPPAGTYALTDAIAFSIVPPADSSSGWTLRRGDERHAIVPAAGGGWRVPALDMEVEVAERDGVPGIRVRRYGEVVFAPRGEDAPALPAGTSAGLAELTPRLMIGLNVPGVGIALIREGAIAWQGAFGVKRAGAAERVDSLTVFEAASMSKPAYTYPFMKLIENGTMELDTPLVRYLGRDYIEGDTLHRLITARMVLSHTTGFPNWRGDEGLTVDFTPGTRVGYSGEGFQYLQTVVEAVTGMPMDEFARRRLFEPLGLASASYVWRDAYEATMAFGHTTDGEPRARAPYLEPNAAYTLYVTPADYARILIEIMRDDRSAPHSVGAATRALMLSSQQVVADREPVERRGQAGGVVHFALGWRFDRTDRGDVYWHSGSNSTGFQCYAQFDPSTGDGIVIMTNGSSGSPLWRSLMREVGLS